jgi:hypothetical protein
MDLQQRKLKKSEWDSIEISVSQDEMDVLQMIIQGYHDVNVKINNHNSIFTFLKIEYSEKIEDYVFVRFLLERVSKIEKALKTFETGYEAIKMDSSAKVNSADKIRLERFDENTLKKNNIYEFILLDHIELLLRGLEKSDKKMIHLHYYTLYKLIKNNILRVNRHIVELTNRILRLFEEKINFAHIIQYAVEIIEKNESLLKYGDLTLYEHQKEIFTVCKSMRPKLVLYMAPTGTGKTLTPIALSEGKKIIFVCAARHVGLALAKAAISAKKKIAFAFGCSSAADIRLHYFAAKVFTRNKRTGGIGKVDNSVGDNVEIMICDIRSYLPAMYYMLAFFPPEDIIMYWDEPTITLDYDDHTIHSTIRQNWKENQIPNIVLSSATLPKQNELTETIPDFLTKFPGAEVCNIVSHDCKKSIPIVNKDGFVVLPHYLNENYSDILKVAKHCSEYLTLMRYFDLKEVVEFIHYVYFNKYCTARTNLDRHFETLDDINMKNIKVYYLTLLKNILPEKWSEIFEYFKIMRKPRILENNKVDTKGNRITKVKSIGPGITVENVKPNPLSGAPLIRLASEQITSGKTEEPKGTSGVYVSTKDAYTLTDGPTIFISDDVEKIAKFCIQQANIPAIVMEDLSKKIEYNNAINERLSVLESESELIKEQNEQQAKNSVSTFHNGSTISGRNKGNKDTKKASRDTPEEMESKGKLNKLTQEITSLRFMIKSATLNDTFIPNNKLHLEKWTKDIDTKGAFTSNIDEQTVCDIMALNGIENSWKVLLMMGIGVFINHENIAYTEIMKKLADEQKLYMIIASSDYIYGTNYQFCHGFLSKDLNLTQEKIIQAMGRIGRNNIQQTYTVRFRDDEQISKLFTSDTEKPEIINMNRLFNSKNVVWRENEYIEVPEVHEKAVEVEEEV